MESTFIFKLDTKEKENIKAEAYREGVSMAEIIRRAIKEYNQASVELKRSNGHVITIATNKDVDSKLTYAADIQNLSSRRIASKILKDNVDVYLEAAQNAKRPNFMDEVDIEEVFKCIHQDRTSKNKGE